MTTPAMTTPMSATIRQTLNSFETFYKDVISQPSYHDRYSTEVSVSNWEDELGRLRVWAHDVGTFEPPGPNTVDARLGRLRYSGIGDEFSILLEELRIVIEEAKKVVSRSEEEEEDAMMEEIEIGEQWTDLESLYREVLSIINCLNKMSRVLLEMVSCVAVGDRPV